jgi:hypothetical protein
LAGGCPAASYFLLSRQKKVTKEKATPLIPEFPKTEPAGWATKNSPRFCSVDFIVSGAQTPLPLIHPTRLIFGGPVRGESQNQGGDDWTAGATFDASRIRSIELNGVRKDCPNGSWKL